LKCNLFLNDLMNSLLCNNYDMQNSISKTEMKHDFLVFYMMFQERMSRLDCINHQYLQKYAKMLMSIINSLMFNVSSLSLNVVFFFL